MKYKKPTITGIALTLALVLAVTVGFASSPVGAEELERDNEEGTTTIVAEHGVVPENVQHMFDIYLNPGTGDVCDVDVEFEVMVRDMTTYLGEISEKALLLRDLLEKIY